MPTLLFTSIGKKMVLITCNFCFDFFFLHQNVAQILSRTNSNTVNRKSKKLEMIYGTESINIQTTESKRERVKKRERETAKARERERNRNKQMHSQLE